MLVHKLFKTQLLSIVGGLVIILEGGLRCCATNRKVAGSIPAGVIGTFH